MQKKDSKAKANNKAAAVCSPTEKGKSEAKKDISSSSNGKKKKTSSPAQQQAHQQKEKQSSLASPSSLLLAAAREDITLLKQPLRTLRLFVEIAVRSGLSALVTLLKHPLTIFVAVPLVCAAVYVSMHMIPPHDVAVFNQFDTNNDGTLTATEVAAAMEGALTTAQVTAAFGGINQFSSVAAFQKWWATADNDNLVAAFLHHLPHSQWREAEYILADVLWWFVLGVLSSVGLGTGMHSGLLFLFPHIYLTCSAADACGNSNFWTYPTNIFYGPKERTFTCITDQSAAAAAASSSSSVVATVATVSLLVRLLKVVPWCIVWGAGTALGEVPPYLLSYAAAKEGKQTDELEEVSAFDILNRMKNWMLDKIKTYGFWAILLLAAWPNAAFDLCGMACGQFMMPFWTFFGATFVGKALIKVNGQAFFFVALFSGDTIESLVRAAGVSLERLIPAAVTEATKIDVAVGVNKVVAVLHDTRSKIEARARDGGKHVHESENDASKAPNALQVAMQWFVVVAVAWFAKSIIDTFAQKRQEQKDERLVALSEEKVKKIIRRRNVWSHFTTLTLVAAAASLAVQHFELFDFAPLIAQAKTLVETHIVKPYFL